MEIVRDAVDMSKLEKESRYGQSTIHLLHLLGYLYYGRDDLASASKVMSSLSRVILLKYHKTLRHQTYDLLLRQY